MDNKFKKLVIFDLDGTLYSFKQGSFAKSDLKKRILSGAKEFIKNRLNITDHEAKKILQETQSEYGEHISVGLEKKFGIDRTEYFNTVWNLNPKELIKPTLGLKSLLSKLLKNGYDIILVSDSPKVWITNVLRYLKITNFFIGKIYSGESDNRKAFVNIFNNLARKLNYQPKDCIIIGDQEQTDILPAKEIGATAIFVNTHKKSKIADYSINSVLELKEVLNL